MRVWDDEMFVGSRSSAHSLSLAEIKISFQICQMVSIGPKLTVGRIGKA